MKNPTCHTLHSGAAHRSFVRMSAQPAHGLAIFALGLILATPANAEPNCAALHKEAFRAGTSIATCDAGREVVGGGRLQFYSAPDPSCKMPGIFVIKGQSVIAHKEYQGFTSVLYVNADDKEDVIGWVSTARLKRNGMGTAPCP